MALVESISGIRGTTDDGALSPELVRVYIDNYSQRILKGKRSTIAVGYDGRSSGRWIVDVVAKTLVENGMHVIDLGIATTPTVSYFAKSSRAVGAVIVSASHNPVQWNGLKFLDTRGEFLGKKEVVKIIDRSKSVKKKAGIKPGTHKKDTTALSKHVKAIISQKEIDTKEIKNAKYKILVDGINASGVLAIPALLAALGVKDTTVINHKVGASFAHTPEPLPGNLTDTIRRVRAGKYDMGIVVDPDADRLVFIGKGGAWIGEEYTLVMAVDALTKISKMKNFKTVTNMSSSLALEYSVKGRGKVFYAPVGEYNVVQEMKKRKAVIGGEGNGGVIWGKVHFGRDSLVGVALVLSFLARNGLDIHELRSSYKDFFFLKEKIELSKKLDMSKIEKDLRVFAKGAKVDTRDGIKISFASSWIHIRASNTEPILRIYIESENEESAREMFDSYKRRMLALI